MEILRGKFGKIFWERHLEKKLDVMHIREKILVIRI